MRQVTQFLNLIVHSMKHSPSQVTSQEIPILHTLIFHLHSRMYDRTKPEVKDLNQTIKNFGILYANREHFPKIPL